MIFHSKLLVSVAFVFGYLCTLLCYATGYKLFGCYIKLSPKIIFFFVFVSSYLPFLRARQYYKNQPIRLGFFPDWGEVSLNAGEKKRKLALFFDTIFYLICTVVIVVAYFFSDKRCQIF